MNWCMVAICGLCIPLLFVFKERYARLELDATNIQRDRQKTRHRQPKASITEDEGEKKLLLSHEDSIQPRKNYTSSINSTV